MQIRNRAFEQHQNQNTQRKSNIRTTQMVQPVHALPPDRVLFIFESWSPPLSHLFWRKLRKSRSHLKLYYRKQEAKPVRPSIPRAWKSRNCPACPRIKGTRQTLHHQVSTSTLLRAGRCQGGRLSLKCQDKTHLHLPSV